MNLRLRNFRPGVDTTKPFDCSDADLNGFLIEASTGTPNAKRRSSYPALKIGRLAVSADMKGQDIGTKIINYIQTRCISNPSTGCRFITVDAYLSAVGFYLKCDFKFLVQPEPEDETVLMFFDLKSMLK